jgi:DNA adenine methylase
MPTYLCEKCDKTFEQKSHFDKHKIKKIPCKKTVEKTVILALTKPLARPFLKWVGGKTQIIEKVLASVPKEINNYYEPFLGGGSVLLGFLSHRDFKGKVYASDINPYIIALYKFIQNTCDLFIAELKKIVDTYNSIKGTEVNRKPTSLEEALTSQESYYYYMRSRFNGIENRTSIEACAILLFLNKTCFRGVYREGPSGFNVPFGHYDSPQIYDEQHLKDISKLIQNVEFRCCSFDKALTGLTENDFVYLDPPYAPINEKSFVGYIAEGFSLDNHIELFKICKEMKNKFVMSNAEVKLVKENFPDEKYSTTIISCRRAINSKDPASRTNEVLIAS